LIALQLIAFGGYLSYVVIFYAKLAPLITQARGMAGKKRCRWRCQLIGKV
jgi:hypothetical protein